ncbi:unnamed protein product [Pseudo-nitzschia multistriata]|uniref:Uncharacterized protein n=1 Tax=Pseudo-nitzschia multistriata TaxID=183589 RepID=A0A448ZG82_9STRA|nr:unnamed protein product [Pseudo-nitzschia multistriata]
MNTSKIVTPPRIAPSWPHRYIPQDFGLISDALHGIFDKNFQVDFEAACDSSLISLSAISISGPSELRGSFPVDSCSVTICDRLTLPSIS